MGQIDRASYIHWNKARVLRIEPNIMYGNYKESACMSLLSKPFSQQSVDVSLIWTLSSARKSEIFCTIQFRMYLYPE